MNLCKRCNADIPEEEELCGSIRCHTPYVYNPDTEWVPIESGQIPKPGTGIGLILTIGNEKRRYSISGYFYKGQFKDEDGDVCQNIIAWRNLPEPYKGDK
jgi:hypothetical protein